MMFKVKNSRGRSFYLYSCHGLFMIYWLQNILFIHRDTGYSRTTKSLPTFFWDGYWVGEHPYIYMYLYLYLCFYICTRMSQGEHENSEVPGDRHTGFLWCSFWFDPMYACGKTIFPETNTAPENQWLEDDMSFWDGLFSGAMLRSGSVMVFNLNFGYLNSSQTVESHLWCFRDVRSGITFSEDTPVNQLQNWHPSETPKYSEFQINWELESFPTGECRDLLGRRLIWVWWTSWKPSSASKLVQDRFLQKIVLAEVSWNAEFHTHPPKNTQHYLLTEMNHYGKIRFIFHFLEESNIYDSYDDIVDQLVSKCIFTLVCFHVVLTFIDSKNQNGSITVGLGFVTST